MPTVETPRPKGGHPPGRVSAGQGLRASAGWVLGGRLGFRRARPAAASVAVFLRWQGWQTAARLSGSSVPPWATGWMWSTSSASLRHPGSRSRQSQSSRSSISVRSCRHLLGLVRWRWLGERCWFHRDVIGWPSGSRSCRRCGRVRLWGWGRRWWRGACSRGSGIGMGFRLVGRWVWVCSLVPPCGELVCPAGWLLSACLVCGLWPVGRGCGIAPPPPFPRWASVPAAALEGERGPLGIPSGALQGAAIRRLRRWVG